MGEIDILICKKWPSIYERNLKVALLGKRLYFVVLSTERNKNSSTLSEFKRRLKSWDGNICNCRLCKVFILGVGFL